MGIFLGKKDSQISVDLDSRIHDAFRAERMLRHFGLRCTSSEARSRPRLRVVNRALRAGMESAMRALHAASGALHSAAASPTLTRALDAAAVPLSRALQATLPSAPALLDASDVALSRAIVATVVPPLVWNGLGRLELHTRAISKLTRRPLVGVYACGAVIAAVSVLRSALFAAAMRSQPRAEMLDAPLVHAAAGALGVFGAALFVGAYCRLGIVGTYLGDYFGLLREDRVAEFPFSVVDNPMYDGSSMVHLAEALLYASPAGVLLAAWLFFCYRVGCIFEEPFTARMYAERGVSAQEQRDKRE
ncbi:Phosphatidylethanolamine N-methyltransferase [Chondrus crispus]|uniref:Phosphatidylethanolamine N-methyltransferase n=1 Tax=Chondrus crispus TaxID=2769 RepID=R7Q789_CHOCR|nr:Phosphatidylethanolamine N-methyltransferase [Chondrus crispus]CDF34397.1 Phosphatidylethanolamine N-methyltransferase [Chondrus crispus]|eukprot:XP_005714216.1 Phosphatidylethanolamine N-methyltransferase [Chondrus crispus]